MKKPSLVIVLLMTIAGVCPVHAQRAQPFDERLAVFETVRKLCACTLQPGCP
jgi:hypothetical protein